MCGCCVVSPRAEVHCATSCSVVRLVGVPIRFASYREVRPCLTRQSCAWSKSSLSDALRLPRIMAVVFFSARRLARNPLFHALIAQIGAAHLLRYGVVLENTSAREAVKSDNDKERQFVPPQTSATTMFGDRQRSSDSSFIFQVTRLNTQE